MSQIKIVKNFLPEEEIKKLENMFFSKDFMWRYNYQTADNDNESFFYHLFYVNNAPFSRCYDQLIPFLNLLEPLSIIGIRANMYINKYKKYFGGWHTDKWSNEKLNHTTSILYINDNNGVTEFENGESIKSERNKLIEFPADFVHRPISQTDQDRRILINLNYFK
jgi:hypothetical protein|tara:strand:+ start:133 stop:627 length:495 start_codon:yes stop_codon:yes gene_type:complete